METGYFGKKLLILLRIPIFEIETVEYGHDYGFLVVMDSSEFLFLLGNLFVRGHRFTQYNVENIFSQVKSKAGQLPNFITRASQEVLSPTL